MTARVVTLDVRDDLRRGRDPFGRIMQTVDALQAGESLRLIAPFEPIPLFEVLSERGFAHRAQVTGAGDWEVLFERCSPQTAPPPAPAPAAPPSRAVGPIPELDARGLEPPQPLVRILEAVRDLPPGAVLRARTDRRPMHLYAQLEARGFTGESEEQSDGSFITSIRRR